MNKTTIPAIVIILMVIGGCQHSTTPLSSGNRVIPFASATWNANNYAATFLIYQEATKGLGTSAFSDSDALVMLWDSGSSVNGGTVKINSTIVPTVDHTSGGGGINYELSSLSGQIVPMTCNGSQLIFSASGSADFSALADTLDFVNKKMNITAPAIGDSISKSAGFTLSWGYNGGSTNTVVLQLSAHGDTAFYETALASDNGSYSVPPGVLSDFAAGDTLAVSLTRITYLDKTASDGRLYAMASYSRELDYHYLKP